MQDQVSKFVSRHHPRLGTPRAKVDIGVLGQTDGIAANSSDTIHTGHLLIRHYIKKIVWEDFIQDRLNQVYHLDPRLAI